MAKMVKADEGVIPTTALIGAVAPGFRATAYNATNDAVMAMTPASRPGTARRASDVKNL